MDWVKTNLQDQMRNILVLGFGATYIISLTLPHALWSWGGSILESCPSVCPSLLLQTEFLLLLTPNYSDIIMSMMASQITGISIVCSTVCTGADQGKHQSFASLAFIRWIHGWLVDSPHKGPVTWKVFPFNDGIKSLTVCCMFYNFHRIPKF